MGWKHGAKKHMRKEEKCMHVEFGDHPNIEKMFRLTFFYKFNFGFWTHAILTSVLALQQADGM